MKQKRQITIFFLLYFFLTILNAEQMHSPQWGYSLDLPEGFVLSSSQEGARYQFDHTMLPVTLAIASYTPERYIDAYSALESAYTSLNAQGDIEKVLWYGQEHAIGFFSIAAGSSAYSGWAVSIVLPENKGITVFLSYSPQEQFAQCEQIIVSTLDSINIFGVATEETGMFTSYAYPAEGDKSIEIVINGKRIEALVDKSDIGASDFVIQREYAILSYFANTPYWKEAWQRFYRIVYRDSYKRLERVSLALNAEIKKDVTVENNENYDREVTQILLTWVQGFEYVRIPLGTDFVPLPAIISGYGSDCDSRALLLSVIMDHMGYKTMLFVSREYSHALFGIEIAGQGARLEHDGISYLLGETTASVAVGLIPQDMSEISKWIAIDGL